MTAMTTSTKLRLNLKVEQFDLKFTSRQQKHLDGHSVTIVWIKHYQMSKLYRMLILAQFLVGNRS